MMRRTAGWILILLMVPVLSCTGVGINQGDFSLISIGEEWELGKQFSADIATQMRILDDPAIVAYINAMGQTILAQSQGDSRAAQMPWEFHVVDDPSVNAFNIPGGGHVYFNSGLIESASSYAEVMGVMGHEVSHGLARHGVENMSKQYGISIVASLVLGENPQVYQELLANILAGGAIMKFSRDAEREADRLGIGYMYAAGVDPQGMVSFFEVLAGLRQSSPSAIELFFSSHPLTQERIDSARSQIGTLGPRNLTLDDAGFSAFQKAVAARAKKTS